MVADLDGAPCSNYTTQPDAGGEFGVGRVRDVVLHKVSPQPVGEVQEMVIKGDENISDQRRDLRQDPPLHLGPGLPDHHRGLPFLAGILQMGTGPLQCQLAGRQNASRCLAC